MERALVLNASFEPLSVVPARRALILVLNDKAELIEPSGLVLHSERAQFDVPAVVRLSYFVKVPFVRVAALNRRAVFQRDGHSCQYCGGHAESIDHVVPRSRGGGHTWENVVAACRRCNTTKRDRLLSETTMRLRTPPREPDRLSWVRATVNLVPQQWEPWLGITSKSA